MDRWATFDCYGTLIDWDGGVRAELARVFGDARGRRAARALPRARARAAARRDAQLSRGADRGDARARRAGRRRARPGGVAARLARVLGGARRRSRSCAAAAGSSRSSRTPTTTSSRPRRCRSACRSTRSSSRRRSARTSRRTATGRSSSPRTRAPREGHVHVGASLFHDIAPANELGLRSVWINRLGERRATVRADARAARPVRAARDARRARPRLLGRRSSSDAAAIAALYERTYGEFRPTDAEEIRTWLENDAARRRRGSGSSTTGAVSSATATCGFRTTRWPSMSPHRVTGSRSWTGRKDMRAASALSVFGCGSPHGPRARAGARRSRIQLLAFLVHDGDRACGAPNRLRPPRGAVDRDLRDDDAEPLRALLNEAFAGDPFFHEVSPSNFRAFYVESRGFDPTLWFLAWEGEELVGSALAYPCRGSDDDARLGRDGQRARALARPRDRPRHCFAPRSWRCTTAACGESGSASTPKTRPVRCSSTRASACAGFAGATTGRKPYEP